MTRELSIIIVNYNGDGFLKNCIESLKSNCHDIDYEIIIVDNASQDKSVKLLETEFSNDIKLLKNKENLGFAKANNLGVSLAKGEFILLLNNDTIIKHKLNPALSVFKDASVGIVSIKMLGKYNEYRYSAGLFPSVLRLFKLSKLYIKNNGFKNGNFDRDQYEVDWIEGSFMLIRREVWKLTGGLNEAYFMYVEDIDFCKKVSLINYKTIYCPKLEYIHFGGYSASRNKLLKEGLIRYVNTYFFGFHKMLALGSIAFNFKIKNVKEAFKKTAN